MLRIIATLTLVGLAAAASAAEETLSSLCRDAGASDCRTLKLTGRQAPPGAGAHDVQGAPVCSGPSATACWSEYDIERVSGRVYRHPAGWLVQERCFERYGPAALMRAFDEAAAKFGAACLQRLNPVWSATLLNGLKRGSALVVCPNDASMSRRHSCGSTAKVTLYRMPQGQAGPRGSSHCHQIISLYNAEACIGEGGPGLPAMMFHETLHAAGEDEGPGKAATHTVQALHSPDDLIYSAQAVCFGNASGGQMAAVTSRMRPGDRWVTRPLCP